MFSYRTDTQSLSLNDDFVSEILISYESYHRRLRFEVFLRHLNIVERVVRLLFDVLHGIKRMDVPLIMVVEFMIFLAYDGKLESNSDMEKELFTSAINQFKERSSTLVLILYITVNI